MPCRVASEVHSENLGYLWCYPLFLVGLIFARLTHFSMCYPFIHVDTSATQVGITPPSKCDQIFLV